jgi:hypothetical protein
LPARHVHTLIDANRQAAENGRPGNPRQWLAPKTSFNERLEHHGVTIRTLQQFFGLFAGRDEPGVS